eukprot:1177855-Prorocentrum_minimum.AAC.2
MREAKRVADLLREPTTAATEGAWQRLAPNAMSEASRHTFALKAGHARCWRRETRRQSVKLDSF